MRAERLYLLDVEGTVAPLTLTADVLFPYARKHLRKFLADNIDDPAVRGDLILLAQENSAESESSSSRIEGAPGPSHWGTGDSTNANLAIDRSLTYLHWLMDRDRKSTALKSLQGRIWKAGFESGELVGTVFNDVAPAFVRWSAQGKVAIYSSGSVDAQKLFFRHSSHGDLTPFISAYFDTRTGPKRETASYKAIASAMQTTPADCIFFSDVVAELDAARATGFQTQLVIRPGNLAVGDSHRHPALESFALF